MDQNLGLELVVSSLKNQRSSGPQSSVEISDSMWPGKRRGQKLQKGFL